jgi:hypothetical protein
MKYNKLTQQQIDAYNKRRRELRKEKMAKWTPEEWKAYSKKRHEKWIEKTPEERTILEKQWLETRWSKMTPEQRLAEKDRHRQRRANFTQAQLDQERKRGRDNVRRLKMEVLNHYAKGELKCANPNCEVPGGAKDVRGLQIDHINGGGYKHSQELKKNGTRMYAWLKKNNFPEGYQVLCASCNIIKKVANKEDYTPRKNKRTIKK